MMFYKFRQCKAVVSKYVSHIVYLFIPYLLQVIFVFLQTKQYLEISHKKLIKELENESLDSQLKAYLEKNLASVKSSTFIYLKQK